MIEGFLYDVFGEMPAQRLNKCRQIYHLARTCEPDGAFVDLGTWLGHSTIAMTVGSLENDRERLVYTVDTFSDRKGWIGEPYGEEDMAVFHANLLKAKTALAALGYSYFVVIHLRTDASELGQTWPNIPIALLHWDLGCDSKLEDDLADWMPHVTLGGHMVVHDTMDNRFGAVEVLDIPGWTSPRHLGAGLHLVTREEENGQ